MLGRGPEDIRGDQEPLRINSGDAHLGEPFEGIPIIHIGGTSGKGSTSLPRMALNAAKQCIAAAFDPARDGFAEEIAHTRQLYQQAATRERVAAFLHAGAR